MNKKILALTLSLSAPAGAADFGMFYGKGIGNNPNSDYVEMRIYSESKSDWRNYLSIGSANGVVVADDDHKWVEGSSPFSSFGIGVQYSNNLKYNVYWSGSVGAAILNKTLDGSGYAPVLEWRLEIGVKLDSVSFGFALNEMSKPKLQDEPWHDLDCARPRFFGYFIRIDV